MKARTSTARKEGQPSFEVYILKDFELVQSYMQRYEGRDDRLAQAMRWFWRWVERRTEGSFYE